MASDEELIQNILRLEAETEQLAQWEEQLAQQEESSLESVISQVPEFQRLQQQVDSDSLSSASGNSLATQPEFLDI